eukprot:CAMPEP_0116843776 /NCGR_PEP_ID=MMETSP0418-20121206/12284_1 /TAXON_ID=1158023 /ORGANISM="Astrosyne radiata, Strain 13vi08-1A" /LENGTH=153 /DNA_ID=CAMNT_0004474583 /DNA_START=229 /DNA_END=690 /DNA_ORIENTATION=-
MASANTTQDEKNEAMEEIAILSKDKRNARFLLDEGILDSLLYVLMWYWAQRGDASPSNHDHAKRAAACCITLGKAHCAAVHTDGDLMLMSLYERGTVPEERQLAQMLYEIPYHVCSNLNKDSNPQQDSFVLQQQSMPHAEELANAIKDLVDNK